MFDAFFIMDQVFYYQINPNLNTEVSIVFLHEGLGCTKTWQNYPQMLCDKIHISGIVYDRPGYGESPGDLSNRSNEYLIEAADDLNEFINFLKLKKVIIYGHSDGASIGLAFAAKYPNKILCLISEAAHVLNEPVTVKGIKAANAAFNLGKLNGLSKWHGQNYVAVFNAWSNTWTKPNFNLESLKNLLSKITANQLIIQGNKDQYGTNKQYKTIANLTPGKSSIFIPECGHTPFLESQDAVLNEAVKFIISETSGIF